VVFGHEVFHRPVCFGPASEAAPADLGPSQGAASRFRVPASPPRPSPPGVSCPFDDMGRRVRCPRGCLPRHVPSSRVLTSSTVSVPLAVRPRGPLPSMGFSRRSEAASATEPRRLPRCRGGAASRSIAAGFPLLQL
jgi:hypothetical protein